MSEMIAEALKPRMTLPRLFTRDELREYLGGISSSTLARWIDDGKIPGPRQ